MAIRDSVLPLMNGAENCLKLSVQFPFAGLCIVIALASNLPHPIHHLSNPLVDLALGLDTTIEGFNSLFYLANLGN